MTITFRNVFFIFLGLIILWFLFTERAILAPFILGALFAYLFNPVVIFTSKHIKLPRPLVATVTYLLLVTGIIVLLVITTERIIRDFDDIQNFVNHFLLTAKGQINSLPGWLRPTVYSMLISLQHPRIPTTQSLLPFFPQAFSRLINTVIFLVSGYYFLQEGNTFYEKLLQKIPGNEKVEIEILLRKISSVLGRYLRGQLFLVFLMSLVTYISLTILGVRFSLFLGIFSGFAEIIPIIGPVIAATIAIVVVLITGTVHFGLSPLNGAFIVAILYLILRHAEDYLVVPHVMGKITELSPFIIFFAVVAGGHLWGILGLILAVPVAAIIKILLEYSLDQINKRR